ncbi:acyl-CoA N-acyltransferase [Macrophomina phaseolina]|uniref:Acyl-CoA N-acyltransferase n=1 Tax=Macrophomina phaseolina TaxID=35725 RepID=A0ABQ8GDH6_9PEZI|nr:acyl-CoA N-acyltransferase [Macrophomina phaseolina]
MLQSSITKWLTKPRAVTQPDANLDPVPLKPQQANKPNSDDAGNDPAAANPTSNPPPPPPSPALPNIRPDAPTTTTATTTATATISNLPQLHPNIVLAPLTAATLPSFRRLNTLLLEIPYPTKFYDEILTDPQPPSPSPSPAKSTKPQAPPGILIAGIRCRLHSATYTPDLPSPTPTTTTTTNPQAPHLYIATLSTLSPYRRHGVASHLLAAVTRAAVERHGAGAVYAHVWVANESGLEWYRRRGFTVVRRVEGYYRRLKPSGAQTITDIYDEEGWLWYECK